MNYDEYNEVVNGEETYTTIATYLNISGKAFIGWTDEKGSHYDILFAKGAPTFGSNIQGGFEYVGGIDMHTGARIYVLRDIRKTL